MIPSEDEKNLEEIVEIRDKLRSGEYFREARGMYDVNMHDPMAERYFYIFISFMALVILVIAFGVMSSLYPLTRYAGFFYEDINEVEEIPLIKPLKTYDGQSANEAVIKYLLQQYVIARETYEINRFRQQTTAVKTHSNEKVFQQFANFVDPQNADSPISKYQRHSNRTIQVRRIAFLSELELTQDGEMIVDPEQEYEMEVIYDATVTSKETIKKARFRANIAFKYNGITPDKDFPEWKRSSSNAPFEPIQFKVTSYESKRS